MPALLRLSLLPGATSRTFDSLLDVAVKRLRDLEKVANIPSTSEAEDIPPITDIPSPPYRSQDIYIQFPETSPLALWGFSVEHLWQSAMNMDGKPQVWDLLTSRLLLWRSLVGEDASPVGEWARKQVVSNVAISKL
jgi:nucleolar pre-ribosomal-associated protein 1